MNDTFLTLGLLVAFALLAWRTHQMSRLALDMAYIADTLKQQLQEAQQAKAAAETRVAEAGVPNLDAATREELIDYAQAFGRLRKYALISRQAQLYREAGFINAALQQEKLLENIYKSLPEEFRW